MNLQQQQLTVIFKINNISIKMQNDMEYSLDSSGGGGGELGGAIDWQNQGWIAGRIDRVDNGLIKRYTDEVYSKYRIENPFNINHRMKTDSSSRKQIRLTKRTTPSTPQPQPHTININTITPVKAPQIKKSAMLKSTAHSHLRSKTGLSIPQSTSIQRQRQRQRQGEAMGERRLQHMKSSGQLRGYGMGMEKGVEVSEFDICSETKNVDFCDIQVKLDNEEYAKAYSQQLQSSPSCSYCPICQHQVPTLQIPLHEQTCQPLQTLYQLHPSQLEQYLQWKINQHLASIVTIIGNLQIREGLYLEGEGDGGRGEGEGRECVGLVMGQCQEEIGRCIWFQNIKERLKQSPFPNNSP